MSCDSKIESKFGLRTRSSNISSQARFSLEWSRGSGGFGCEKSDSNAEGVNTGPEYASALLHFDPITLIDESDVT